MRHTPNRSSRTKRPRIENLCEVLAAPYGETPRDEHDERYLDFFDVRGMAPSPVSHYRDTDCN
jgi:hypothetical protein